MPYKSEAQRKYFNANRKKLEAEGVDVDHWNEESKGKKLPEKAEKKAYGVSDDNYELDRHLSAMPDASREEMLAATRALMERAKTLDGNLKFTGSRYAELPDEYYDSAEALKRIEALEGDADEELPLFYEISRDDRGPLNWDALAKQTQTRILEEEAKKDADPYRGLKNLPILGSIFRKTAALPEKKALEILSKQRSTGTMNIQELAKLAAGRCWDGYEPVPGKDAYSDDSCRKVGSKKKKEEKEASSCGGSHSSKPKKKKAVKSAALNQLILEKLAGKRGLWDNIHAKRERGEKPAKPGDKDYPDAKSWKKTTKESADAAIKKLVLEKIAKSPAWQREEGKSESGGLNAKGRASLKAQGQDIKAPVTQKNPKGEAKGRKASFCARMGGMKKKLTSSETANDPDSRINKSLRKWNC